MTIAAKLMHYVMSRSGLTKPVIQTYSDYTSCTLPRQSIKPESLQMMPTTSPMKNQIAMLFESQTEETLTMLT
ncbi:hypothetical protein EUGRSUZ_F02970 [Eucalyptus grandis]|uniref:Uncharacterized protein n=2 Tax=Eucalyptus grandis TaxID=71139 RepID=A0ACC3KKL1_EUCGR|nr:hypothetical protein EUGRSUZ_F02970 [Eucalyptus grandis]